MSFASATGSFATFTGLSPVLHRVAQTATGLDLDDGAGPRVDLAATSVTAPTTATPGQPITVNWQVNDQSSQAATGSWQDSVYLSPTPAITASSILLGTVPHTGGLAASGSYNGSLTAAAAGLPPGNYYVLVQVDSLYQVPDPNRANNTLAAAPDSSTCRVPVADARHAAQRLVHRRRPGPLLPGHRAGRRVAGRLACQRRLLRRAGALRQPGDACRRRTTTRKRPTSPTSRARRSPCRRC